jgi:hypothetical protein
MDGAKLCLSIRWSWMAVQLRPALIHELYKEFRPYHRSRSLIDFLLDDGVLSSLSACKNGSFTF